MPIFSGRLFRILPLAGLLFAAIAAPAAQNGNSATVRGTVLVSRATWAGFVSLIA